MVVAINKIDKPDATADVVKQGLLQHEIVLEDFGGDVLSTAVSAKTGLVPAVVAINNNPNPNPDRNPNRDPNPNPNPNRDPNPNSRPSPRP